MRKLLLVTALSLPLITFGSAGAKAMGAIRGNGLCLDGFCIGQSINALRFEQKHWIVPANNPRAVTKYRYVPCTNVTCSPTVAFRGYPSKVQQNLASALSWQFTDGSFHSYTIITNKNLSVLQQYRYECVGSPGGFEVGERRFMGGYWSRPSHYLTVVGLRLIGGELRVYRIARQFPYHNADELVSLGQQIYHAYGHKVLLYRYLSSNAPFSVQKDGADGWFGRSTLFNPENSSVLDAELVLIDPGTRKLLQPTSMPDSGEISFVPNPIPNACARHITIH